MTLANKNVVVYGAAGSLGSTISKEMARAGARIILTGLHAEPLQALADKISGDGGLADVGVVDAMDSHAVQKHLADRLAKFGTIDISFNLIDLQVEQNKPLTELSMDSFLRPVTIAMQSHFITATSAAKIMMKQGSGVILSLTATPASIAYPGVGGFGPACAAMESFSKNLASEVGIYGIRVVNIRSAGSPDSRVFAQAVDDHPAEMKWILQKMEADTMLKKLPLMKDIASIACFLGSDLACSITGVTVDITSGTTAGLAYRTAIDA